MRKIMPLLLTVGLSICFCSSVGAVTLPELRAEAPDRLRITVEGPDGPVIIDAPVTLPEGDALPMVRAQSLPIDNLAVCTHFGMLDFVDDGYGISFSDQHTGGLFLQFPHWSERLTYIPDKYGGLMGSYRAPSLSRTLENNPLPYEAPAEFLAQVLSLAGVPEADVRIVSQTAYGPAYKASRRRVDDPDIVDVAVPDYEHPIPGREMGYWSFACVQYLDGIPIFPAHYQIGVPNKYGEGGEASEGLSLYGDMVNREDALLILELLQATEQIEAAPDLVSFETVLDAIEGRVQSGLLLDVQSLELGYMVVAAGTVGEPGEEHLFENKRYALTPVWQIRGYDTEKASTYFKSFRVSESGRVPSDLDYALLDGLELRMDARTGAFLGPGDYRWTE